MQQSPLASLQPNKLLDVLLAGHLVKDKHPIDNSFRVFKKIKRPGYNDKLHNGSKASDREVLRTVEQHLNCTFSKVHPDPRW